MTNEKQLQHVLNKAGCRPDPTGDSGVHDVTYAFLPHVGGLSAEEVVQPAYRLNHPPRVFAGSRTLPEAPVTVSNELVFGPFEIKTLLLRYE